MRTTKTTKSIAKLMAIVMMLASIFSVTSVSVYADTQCYLSPTTNASGQYELTITYNGATIQYYLKGNNVYNRTYNNLISDCKGVQYVCVKTSNGVPYVKYVGTDGYYKARVYNQAYSVDMLDTNGNRIYSNGAVLNDLMGVPSYQQQTTNYPTQQTYPSGTYYPNGTYNPYGNGGYNYNNTNGYYNESYDRDDVVVDRDGNDVKDDNSYNKEKYIYELDGKKLYYKGYYYQGRKNDNSSYTISSSVDDFGFVDGYVVYATKSGSTYYVYATEIGSRSKGDKLDIKNYKSMEKKRNSDLIDYIKVKNGKLYDGNIIDIIDDDYDDDDDDEDIEVTKSGSTYTVEYDGDDYKYKVDDGKVKVDGNYAEYDDEKITNMSDIAWSEGGYCYILTDDNVLLQAEIGDEDFDKVEEHVKSLKKSHYIVSEYKNNDGDTEDIDDFE